MQLHPGPKGAVVQVPLPPVHVPNCSKSAARTLPVVSMPRRKLASTFEASDCAHPLVTRGTNVAIPLVPVVAGVPGPSRRNHVSIVNCGRCSAEGSPKVT